MSYEKNSYVLSIESWLVYRDPYIGLLKSPYFNWLIKIPYIQPKQPGSFFIAQVFFLLFHTTIQGQIASCQTAFSVILVEENWKKKPVKFMNQSEFQKIINWLVGGFNPSEKYESNLVHLPQVGMNIKKH